MPPVKRLLGNSTVKAAQRAASCKRNKSHSVAKGELRLIIKNPGPAAGQRGYCAECGLEILALAEADIRQLRRQLVDTASK